VSEVLAKPDISVQAVDGGNALPKGERRVDRVAISQQ
jgi:hypothetical protein